MERFDAVVVGAGVFGAWTALHFARRNNRVLLLDAYGPGNARASSAGESRIIRMGYGADEIYTRWSQKSLAQWKEFFGFTRPGLFRETGVLWLGAEGDARVRDTAATLTRCGVAFEELDQAALRKRYPQIGLDGIATGLLEPESGVLMARRAVAAVVEDAIFRGVQYRVAEVVTPDASGGAGTGMLTSLRTRGGEEFEAEHFVFACGAWLGKVFPEVLGRADFSDPAGDLFFWGAGGGFAIFAGGAAYLFVSGRRDVMGCRIWRGAGSRLRSTGMECVSIRIRSRGLLRRRLRKRCGRMWGGDFRPCGTRRLWRRGFASMRILRAGIF